MTPCSICAKPFAAQTTLHTICSPRCLLSRGVVNRKAEKAERKQAKARLDALKPRSHWMKEAQREFNAYIRLRDARMDCISCGRDHQGQWHAGHYLSTGARPELRFDESNVHKQCQPCNTHLHGNLIRYRVALIARIGADEVALLEGPHPARKYTSDELKFIAREFRDKARELRKAKES